MHEIKELLSKWAYFRQAFSEPGDVGWSEQNILCAFGSSGGAKYPTTGTCLISKWSDGQMVDGWIRELGRSHPELQAALHYYYIFPKRKACEKGPTVMERVKADLGISRRTFQHRVHLAETWLDGRLAAFEAKKA